MWQDGAQERKRTSEGTESRFLKTRGKEEKRREDGEGGVKIRALRERLIKECKLTGANDIV